jgi:putative NADPH-quinone reductase
MSRIVIIEGHPDPAGTRLGNALASAYAEGALKAGHHVDRLTVAKIDFPVLRTAEDWNKGNPPQPIVDAQRTIVSADHLAIFYPLWLGDMPALLKAFLEQVFRPTFPRTAGITATFPKVLQGKTARVVVTMGMPGLFYLHFYRAHSLKSLERNILKFLGMTRVRSTLLGLVEGVSDAKRATWMSRMCTLGAKAT